MAHTQDAFFTYNWENFSEAGKKEEKDNYEG